MKCVFQIINPSNGGRSAPMICSHKDLYKALTSESGLPHALSFILLVGTFEDDQFEFSDSPIITVETFKSFFEGNKANENF